MPLEGELLRILGETFRVDSEGPSGLVYAVARGKMRPGDPAGTLRKDGYWQVRFQFRLYQNHRIVWALYNGGNPGSLEIDHVNGKPWDNRPENLRLASHAENNRNRVNLQSNNSSGFTGIRLYHGKWRVRIKKNGREEYIGSFSSVDEAIAARRCAELRFFGEFAPVREC